MMGGLDVDNTHPTKARSSLSGERASGCRGPGAGPGTGPEEPDYRRVICGALLAAELPVCLAASGLGEHLAFVGKPTFPKRKEGTR